MLYNSFKKLAENCVNLVKKGRAQRNLLKKLMEYAKL